MSELINHKNIPVFVFCYDERTIDFCLYCLYQIGFEEVIKIHSFSSFYEKLKEFSTIAYDLNQELYIRMDADRFVFKGLIELIKQHKLSGSDMSQGIFYDFLMKKCRGGTPHIYSNNTIKCIQNKKIKLLDNNKPESYIWSQIKNKKSFKKLTNLHDYEQYPSKITNTFINRLYRNHAHHYKWKELRKDGLGKEIDEAFKYYNNNPRKTNCSYVGLYDYLDKNLSPIKKTEFPNLYQKYIQIYNEKITSYNL